LTEKEKQNKLGTLKNLLGEPTKKKARVDKSLPKKKRKKIQEDEDSNLENSGQDEPQKTKKTKKRNLGPKTPKKIKSTSSVSDSHSIDYDNNVSKKKINKKTIKRRKEEHTEDVNSNRSFIRKKSKSKKISRQNSDDDS